MDPYILEEIVKRDFQFYKAGAILLSLILVIGFQLLFPNRLAIRNMFQNWKVNIPIAGLNAFLITLLCGACVCTWAATVRQQDMAPLQLAALPYWLQVGGTVILLDFVAWFWHWMNHQWNLLWRFHSVHHTDFHFDASTAFRFHPGELLISLGVRLVVVLLTGLPLLGLILFEAVYGLCNLFVHSDIRLEAGKERLLGFLFITPSLHRMHHSVAKEEHNSNFGTIFSFWDRLARTYIYANSDSKVEVGLEETRSGRLLDLIAMPFRR